MSKITGPTYGGYTTATCCSKCDYVWRPIYPRGLPALPAPKICPECGENTKHVIGRWLFSTKTSWGGLSSEKIVHKFVKGKKYIAQHTANYV